MPRVAGMKPPQDQERRAVPRHIRDAEHDAWGDVPAAADDPQTAGRRLRPWVYLAVIAALGLGLWYFLTTRP